MTGETATAANANQRLSAQFNAMLCVSRFAHCVKLMGRDMVGSFKTADDIERRLHAGCRASPTARPAAATGARYPLRECAGRGAGEARPARRLRLHDPAAAALPVGRGGGGLPPRHGSPGGEASGMSTAGEAFKAGDIEAAVAAATAAVKAPAARFRSARWLLAEMLLFAGEFERADRALDAVVEDEPVAHRAGVPPAAAGRGGAPPGARRRPRAEVPGRGSDARAEGGRARADLLRAGDHAGAAAAAAEAEACAAACPAGAGDAAFDDFRDADDIFAAIIEVHTAGGEYMWVPVERLRALSFEAPKRPRDLYWRRCSSR
jgi:type VI secretion system protein ImpE